jgi:glycylpeptide N-tetradecanoyltransferase
MDKNQSNIENDVESSLEDDRSISQIEMLQALSLQERIGETVPPPLPGSTTSSSTASGAAITAALNSALQNDHDGKLQTALQNAISQGKNSSSSSPSPSPSTTTTTTTSPASSSAASSSALAASMSANLLQRGVGPSTTVIQGVPQSLKDHKFWSTQPVLQPQERVRTVDTASLQSGPVVPDKKPEEIDQEAYKLVTGYEWVTVNVKEVEKKDSLTSSSSSSSSTSTSGSGEDTAIISTTTIDEITELYTMLANNYVEDDDHMFRFAYSADFLKWALTPPGYIDSWHLGVRTTNKSKKLVAFISGVPADVFVHGTKIRLCEIDFLCVDKRLRSKRLAPALIKEVTRRVNLSGVFQATYTAGVVLPGDVASCRYWHRSIQPLKLVDVGFSRLPSTTTRQRLQRSLQLPDHTRIPGLRPLEEKDIQQARDGLMSYLSRYKLRPEFSCEEFKHYFMPRENVVDSFVVEEMKEDTKTGEMIGTGKITNFFSFYHLPSTIVGERSRYKTLNAAYLFYYFYGGGVTLKQLMEDCLVCARSKQVDVFNCLDLMENATFVNELKFGIGDGHLQYYLYNFRSPLIEPKDVGLILL